MGDLDIAGHAYIVTISAVLQIAYIQMKTKEMLRLENGQSSK